MTTLSNRKLAIAIGTALLSVAAMPLTASEATVDKDRTVGQVVDDLTIAARTKTALAADPVTEAIDIDVEVDRDMVQLNGFVDSVSERDRAVEIARSVDGVRSVENNLKLQPHDRTAGEYVDDKVLVAQVKAALAEAPKADALAIDVEVDHGVVSLGGYVDTEAQRQAALEAARQVAGVDKVIDNLDVRS